MTRLVGYTLTAAWTAAVIVAAGRGLVELTAGLLVAGAVALVVWDGLMPPSDAPLAEHEGATPEWGDRLAEIKKRVRPVLRQRDLRRRRLALVEQRYGRRPLSTRRAS